MDPEAVASAELKPFIEEWRTHMTLTEISLRTQVSVRQLRRYQTGEIKFVTFAVADKIMTAFGLIPGVDVQVVPNPEYLHNYLRRGCSSD